MGDAVLEAVAAADEMEEATSVAGSDVVMAEESEERAAARVGSGPDQGPEAPEVLQGYGCVMKRT